MCFLQLSEVPRGKDGCKRLVAEIQWKKRTDLLIKDGSLLSLLWMPEEQLKYVRIERVLIVKVDLWHYVIRIRV